MKYQKLNSGQKFPVIGLGTWKLRGDECTQAVENALDLGYRHIDTADAYDNHRKIASALDNTNLDRNKLFITSKVKQNDLHYSDFLESGNRFLEELGIDYLDLLLVHWPNKKIPVKETLDAMAKLKEEGKIKNAGVSNFTINHIKEAFEYYPELIAVNQVEFHPYLYQKELLEFCQDNNIVVTAYSPLTRGKTLKDPIIKKLAEMNGKSPAQIVLKWLVKKGIVVIPKASTKEHLKDNMNIFGWELPREAGKALDNLNKDERLIDPPFGEFNYSF